MISAVMTKRELRAALPSAPLGVRRNKVALAMLLTGQSLKQVAESTGLHPSRISQISNDYPVKATERERIALAKHFGVREAVLFPLLDQPAATPAAEAV